MNLQFPDQTYSSTNKPSSATLKSDLQTVETDFNALEAAAVTLTGSQTLTNKVLTNPTINFTDKAASMNVKARAYAGTNQSFSNGIGARVMFDTESYDIGSDFDSATNYRFTAPVAGYYLIVVKVGITSPADQTLMQIDIKKNGSDLFRVSSVSSGTNNTSLNGSDIQSLDANDYIDVFFTQSSGTSKNIMSGTGNTFLAVHLLSV